MNKKTLAKLSAFAMAATTLLSGCAGGSNAGVDSENTLEIYLLEQGYGYMWCQETIDSFKQQDWVKEKYPNLEIRLTRNDVVSYTMDTLNLGEKYNTYDLMFGQKTNTFYGQDKVLLDLTDLVYNAKVPGEEVTYSEKLNDSVEAALCYTDMGTGDEKYYATPYYTGMYGFIYNEDALKSYNLEVPRTTDEFYNALVTIRNANQSKYDKKDPTAQYGIVQSKDAPYWQKEGSVIEVWWAQYEGVSGYEDFYNGIVNGERSIGIFEQKGRLESLKVMESLLDYDNKFLNPQSFNQEFMVAQTGFLQGSSVFHFNGDYFTDEMKEIKANLIASGKTVPTIKMMKTPIISSIKDKCTTIADDAELSALVKAIDAGSTALTGDGYDVSQKDFNKVKEARSIVNSVGPGEACIPAYAKAKDVAVDFMLYMATDEGIACYCKGASGSTIDFAFDPKTNNPELYASLEPLQQGRIDYMCNLDDPVNVLKKPSAFPLCGYGKVTAFVDTNYYSVLSLQSNNKTAQDFYDETIAYWNDSAWLSALTSAGLQ